MFMNYERQLHPGAKESIAQDLPQLQRSLIKERERVAALFRVLVTVHKHLAAGNHQEALNLIQKFLDGVKKHEA